MNPRTAGAAFLLLSLGTACSAASSTDVGKPLYEDTYSVVANDTTPSSLTAAVVDLQLALTDAAAPPSRVLDLDAGAQTAIDGSTAVAPAP
jgi:hypothetical protein